jgi:hypothetical protein
MSFATTSRYSVDYVIYVGVFLLQSDPLLVPIVVVTDLGSKFGTFANEGIDNMSSLSMREPMNLSPGDKFRFGRQWNIFQ